MFVLEDYDIRVGRYLVQGVDVWLNNPRRPLEASGTSGMKAAMNGVINCSVLDGWWDEGWTEDNGWAIGGREMNPDEGAQDWADAQALYQLLENDIVPRWYDRDRRACRDAGRRSCAGRWPPDLALLDRRMLEQYVEQLYLPAALGEDAESAGGCPPRRRARAPDPPAAVLEALRSRRSSPTAADSDRVGRADPGARRPWPLLPAGA